MDADTGPGGDYTVFRPQNLGQNGFLHAPIIFGPGINGHVTGSAYVSLLTHFASHGFVAVGVNLLTAGPNAESNRNAMLQGLDWIIEQNDAAGMYQGKLYVSRAISMGYSVGGTAAVEIGGHPAIATVVSIHGHEATAELHGPMLQTSGTKDTIGLPMQQYTFDNSKVQTFLGTVTGADHGYIGRDDGGAERPAILAWLRYWTYGDTGAEGYFFGEDCVTCKAPWENPQRKNWQ
jgi:dienelactone hydrolase